MPWSFFFRPARSWTGLRLGRALVVAALAFGPTLAFSQTSGGGYQWSGGIDSAKPRIVGDDPTSVCGQVISRDVPWQIFDHAAALDASHYGCYGSTVKGGPVGLLTTLNRVSGSCAAGYTLQADGSCKANQQCPAAGQSAPGGNTANGTSPTQTILNPQVCVGGCAYTYGSYWTGATPGQTGGYAAQYTGLKSTGSTCSGTGTPAASQSSPADPPKQCGDRQYSGTVQGVSVCIDYPVQTTGGNTSTTTNDAPASSPGANSNSTTTTSTTCDGTTCTTTTTTNTSTSSSSGSSSSSGGASSPAASACQGGAGASAVAGTCTTTTTQPQVDYCKDNPTAAQCKKSSASGGADCSAPPTCDGDAISCAILSQQWNTRCELQKHDDSTDLGAKLANGQDPLAGKLPTPGGTERVDMSSKFSNVDDMGIAAQCLGNIDVPLSLPGGGWNLHIDTTPLCDIGKLLGYLNMLGTMMLCAYMLKGSF